MGPDGSVWLAATSGVYRHDDGRLSLVEATDDETETVSRLFVDSENILWTVTKSSIDFSSRAARESGAPLPAPVEVPHRADPAQRNQP